MNRGGSFRIVATIKASVDSERIDALLARGYVRNMELIKENKQLQEVKMKQDEEIAELRKKLAVVKNEHEKKKLEAGVVSADRKFLANQKAEEGWRLFLGGNDEDAIVLFSYAIGVDEKCAIAYRCRGSVYAVKSDDKRALKDLNMAIEISPKDDLAYLVRGYVYGMQGEYQLAINDLNNAIRISPNPWSYYVRGKIYNLQGKPDQALADFSKAISLNQQFADSYQQRGHVYLQQKHYQQAVADYSLAIKIDPKLVGIYENRGYAYFQ